MIRIADSVDRRTLPAGRHQMTRAEVESSQRGRLCMAIIDAVGENGYAATTIADIVRRAGVARRTFYEQFVDKEDCFVVAFKICVDVVETRMRAALTAAGDLDWDKLTAGAIESYLAILADEPAATRALHVETLGAGPAILQARREMVQVFADRMRAAHALARAQMPDIPVPPTEAFDFLIEGIDGMIRNHLTGRPASELGLIGPLLSQCAFAIFGVPRYRQNPPAVPGG